MTRKLREKKIHNNIINHLRTGILLCAIPQMVNHLCSIITAQCAPKFVDFLQSWHVYASGLSSPDALQASPYQTHLKYAAVKKYRRADVRRFCVGARKFFFLPAYDRSLPQFFRKIAATRHKHACEKKRRPQRLLESHAQSNVYFIHSLFNTPENSIRTIHFNRRTLTVTGRRIQNMYILYIYIGSKLGIPPTMNANLIKFGAVFFFTRVAENETHMHHKSVGLYANMRHVRSNL